MKTIVAGATTIVFGAAMYPFWSDTAVLGPFWSSTVTCAIGLSIVSGRILLFIKPE